MMTLREKMTSSWIETFAQQLIKAGLATEDTLEGCSEEDIAQIESAFNVELPKTYKDYLKKMGTKADGFLGECTRTYPGIVKYARESAGALLEARTSYRLPDTAFVFVERYGCQFFFFDTASGDDDPPVFRYFEGDECPVQIAGSFTDALKMALEDELNDLDPESDEPYKFAI